MLVSCLLRSGSAEAVETPKKQRACHQDAGPDSKRATFVLNPLQGPVGRAVIAALRVRRWIGLSLSPRCRALAARRACGSGNADASSSTAASTSVVVTKVT